MKIDELKQKTGLTIAELAANLKCHPVSISRWQKKDGLLPTGYSRRAHRLLETYKVKPLKDKASLIVKEEEIVPVKIKEVKKEEFDCVKFLQNLDRVLKDPELKNVRTVLRYFLIQL